MSRTSLCSTQSYVLCALALLISASCIEARRHPAANRLNLQHRVDDPGPAHRADDPPPATRRDVEVNKADADQDVPGSTLNPAANYAIAVSPANPTRGQQTAPVTIIEFGAFGCARCAELTKTLEALQARHPDVRLAFRHLPDPTDAGAMRAARASIAAATQGRFWPFAARLNDADETAIDQNFLNRIAAELELDVGRLRRDMGSEQTSAILDEDRSLARTLDAPRFAPFVFVNGRFLAADATPGQIEALIAEERIKAAAFAQAHPEVSPGERYEAMRKTWRGAQLLDAKVPM